MLSVDIMHIFADTLHPYAKSHPPPQEMVDTDCDCTICQENFELGEETIRLPCDHHFHLDCGLPWFEAHDNCPVCRMALPSAATPSSAGVNANDNSGMENLEGFD